MNTRLLRAAAIVWLAPAVVLCGARGAVAQGRGGADPTADKALADASARPTPRTPDGHPDLNGSWGAPGGGGGGNNGPGTVERPVLKLSSEQERANDITGVARRKANTAGRPEYKPEFQQRWSNLFDNAVKEDPSYKCLPLGVPRVGAPREIVQTPKTVYFLYAGAVTTPNLYRIIPADGRPHDKDADPMPMGDAIARWEGDTLVVETVNFDDGTWINGDGTFHSDAYRTVERLTRKGDTLTWDVTAEDPKFFAKPFKLPTRTLVRAPEGTHAPQDYGCIETDQEHAGSGTLGYETPPPAPQK